MYAYIFKILDYLAFILPFNFWLVFTFITAPVIIFTTKPKQEAWLKASKLILVIVLTYIFLNLSVHTQHTLDYNTYLECMNQPQNKSEHCEHHINPDGDGAQAVFALFFGWLYLIPYFGLCEFLWRLRHRKILKEQHKQQWHSNTIIVLGIIVSMLWVLAIIAAVLK